MFFYNLALGWRLLLVAVVLLMLWWATLALVGHAGV